MLDTPRPSALELDLKRIARSHPDITVHPNSPSGPYVRAVLWTAGDNEQILGQALWSTNHNQWVVRAYDTEVGDTSLVVKNPALAVLDTVAPELADVVRSLRGEA